MNKLFINKKKKRKNSFKELQAKKKDKLQKNRII